MKQLPGLAEYMTEEFTNPNLYSQMQYYNYIFTTIFHQTLFLFGLHIRINLIWIWIMSENHTIIWIFRPFVHLSVPHLLLCLWTDCDQTWQECRGRVTWWWLETLCVSVWASESGGNHIGSALVILIWIIYLHVTLKAPDRCVHLLIANVSWLLTNKQWSWAVFHVSWWFSLALGKPGPYIDHSAAHA